MNDRRCIRSSNLEGIIQHLLDMGGGNWDRDTVVRALRVVFNNPEKQNSRQLPEFHHCQVCRLPSPRQLQLFLKVDQIQTLWISSLSLSIFVLDPVDCKLVGLPDMGTNAPVGAAGNLDFLRNSPQCSSFKHFKPWCKLIPKSCSFDSEQFQEHHLVEESWDAGFNDDWNIGMLEELKAEDSEGIIGSQSHVEKSLDKLNARNQILRDQFGIDIEAKRHDEGF
uniref:Uncharacterized protein n=1 Tax=Lactuca sativa TaxID=4236 RepID=A0A9R1WBG8_LACSA|nr:hypothetical protein LSAT_V11C200062140 [Lactuca sativa]